MSASGVLAPRIAAPSRVRSEAAGSVPVHPVLTMARLKFLILRNTFAGEKQRRVGAYVGLSFTGLAALIAFWQFASGASLEEPLRSRSLIFRCGIVFCLWVFGPLVRGGVDDSLDPTVLAVLPLEPRHMRMGLLAGSLIGVVPIGAMVGLAGAAFGYAPRGPGAVVVVFALVLYVLLAVSAARALSVVLAHASRTRKGRDLAVLGAAFAGMLIWMTIQSFHLWSQAVRASLINGLRWSPPGVLAQAVVDASDGRTVHALVRTISVVPITAALFLVWMRGLDRLLVEPDGVRGSARQVTQKGLPIFGRFTGLVPVTPFTALVLKELRYLFRSPQRRTALIISSMIGATFAVLQALGRGSFKDSDVWLAGTAILFGAGTTNNLLGADAAALWLEVSAGTPMRRLLQARGLAAIPAVAAPVVAATMVLGTLTGGWRQVGTILVLLAVSWGIPVGVGSVISVRAPFAQPDVGNPFSNRQAASGQAAIIGLLGIAGLLGTTLLGIPVMIIAALMAVTGFLGNVLLVAVAAAWSLGVWRVGCGIAGRRADARTPELLLNLGSRRANA